jgi:hypothetical protein
VRAAPAVSCANLCKKTHTSIQVQRRHSGFPCAMGYGLLRALPGDRLSCHRRLADTSAKLSASTGAPGPHDFAVRRPVFAKRLRRALCKSAEVLARRTSAFRQARRRVHRIPPRVRDDRDPPLSSGETGRAGSADLPGGLSGLFFQRRLDRLLVICLSGCFVAPAAPESPCEAVRNSSQGGAAAGVPTMLPRQDSVGYAPPKPTLRSYAFASDATPSISISIFGLGSACTTQVVRAG